VSIIVDQRTDVVLVPNGAITSRGGKSYVQVVAADGTTAERTITTGINDWQYTEVTDGLSEGENVVVPQGTTTTSTTSTSQQQGPGGEFGIQAFPGIGGVGR
jgi:multidrug efflux pump subunit AcrA (membrane-fusion protein)